MCESCEIPVAEPFYPYDAAVEAIQGEQLDELVAMVIASAGVQRLVNERKDS